MAKKKLDTGTSATAEKPRESLEVQIKDLERQLNHSEKNERAAHDRADDAEAMASKYRAFASAAQDDLPRLLELCPACKNEPANGVGRFFCETCKVVKGLIDLARETQ